MFGGNWKGLRPTGADSVPVRTKFRIKFRSFELVFDLSIKLNAVVDQLKLLSTVLQQSTDTIISHDGPSAAKSNGNNWDAGGKPCAIF